MLFRDFMPYSTSRANPFHESHHRQLIRPKVSVCEMVFRRPKRPKFRPQHGDPNFGQNFCNHTTTHASRLAAPRRAGSRRAALRRAVAKKTISQTLIMGDFVMSCCNCCDGHCDGPCVVAALASALRCPPQRLIRFHQGDHRVTWEELPREK